MFGNLPLFEHTFKLCRFSRSNVTDSFLMWLKGWMSIAVCEWRWIHISALSLTLLDFDWSVNPNSIAWHNLFINLKLIQSLNTLHASGQFKFEFQGGGWSGDRLEESQWDFLITRSVSIKWSRATQIWSSEFLFRLLLSIWRYLHW